MDVVLRDDIAIDVESIATKYPIVDWKTHVLTENMMYYQIIRADGSSKNYKIFSEMLNDFDRQDVLNLHRQMMIEKKYPLTQEMLSRMLSRRLEVDQESEMAFELLRHASCRDGTRTQLDQNGFELRGAVVVDSAVGPRNGFHQAMRPKKIAMVLEMTESAEKDLELNGTDDRVHLSLLNAEFQINFERLPLWQNTKVHFYVMKSVSVEGFPGEETQIENFLCHEVDIRRMELLPVYEQFNSIKSGWDD
ncbi:retrovirus-related pol polyprotein from transposon TNT 1-94, partial [Tanacetum coccineum]